MLVVGNRIGDLVSGLDAWVIDDFTISRKVTGGMQVADGISCITGTKRVSAELEKSDY